MKETNMKFVIAAIIGVAALGAVILWGNQKPAYAQNPTFTSDVAECILDNIGNAHISAVVRDLTDMCDASINGTTDERIFVECGLDNIKSVYVDEAFVLMVDACMVKTGFKPEW